MTNKEAIEHLKNINRRYPCSLDSTFRDECEQIAINISIKALENQSFDVDEYRKRLVAKYSEGDHATDVDRGISIALDLLDEMEEENT